MDSASCNSPIVIFRAAKGTEDPYEQALSHAGYNAHFVPVLQFEFTNSLELSSLLLDSARFSGLIFTSQTAVDSSICALSQAKDGWQASLLEQWIHLPVFVVGNATAKAVEKLGLKATGSISGNAEILSDKILEYFASHDKSSLGPLLFPCGNLRRETLATRLPQGGVKLHSTVCYNTIPKSDISERLQSLVELKVLVKSCWVAFFSPSGVQFTLDHLKSFVAVDSLKIAAIGPTTSEALSKAGIQPSAVASKPTPEALIEAINATSTKRL